MVVVRFVFQAKWGQAGKVVEDYKQGVGMMKRITGPNAKFRVYTDLSGPFDTVVQEMELESLAEWERIKSAIFSDPEFQDMQSNSENPYISGRTEFYTLEAAF